jgi:dTMP kinase
LLLDLPVEAGLASGPVMVRRCFDRETVAFHERVRAGFLELAHESPGTWRVIDAGRAFELVLDDAAAAITVAI